jgi:hypothetical protein
LRSGPDPMHALTSLANPSAPADRIAWLNRHTWLDGTDLIVEWRQAEEEGRDLSALAAEYAALMAEPAPLPGWRQTLGAGRDFAWLSRAAAWVDRVPAQPFRPDYPYHEPSDLPGIHAARPPAPGLPAWSGDHPALQARLHGGLLGRIGGCLLGKPVEGWTRASLAATGQITANWPLADYWRYYTADELAQLESAAPNHRFRQPDHPGLRGHITGMPEDDDINYTLIGYGIVSRHGPDFTPLQVADYWGMHLPIFHTCTAERVAYRNVVNGILPPHSATVRNPYREWIGAQIRGDFFGYANPGLPERAAAWAWRDASLSHVRNGIYGEMWVSAMLAVAYVETDVTRVIRAGLAQIPARCRLATDLEKIRAAHAAGRSWSEVCDLIHSQWDETHPHDWCHTNSNAQVVAAALLYGGADFETTITLAVMAGFDTDCNGATAGSVWGVMHGLAALPEKWTSPLRDTVRSGVAGFHELPISELAARMTTLTLRHLPPR